MIRFDALALPADWLNAWLAALGTAFLVPGCRVAWSDDPCPYAVFDSDDPLPAALARHLPSSEELAGLAIARLHPDDENELTRNPTVDVYRSRSRIARHNGDPTLSATLTDLSSGDRSELAHSPFDPPAPKGITIWERVASCRAALPDDPAELEAVITTAFTRGGRRIKNNGLGFDYRRILSPTDPTGEVWIDPIIEVLAFHGLALLPVRGNGRRDRSRGWRGPASRRGSFAWPAWIPALDVAGIDAFLDRFWTNPESATDHIRADYATVPYQPRGQMDQTRGYASERRP